MDRSERLRAWDEAQRPAMTPSMLNCDFNRVSEEMDALAKAGAPALHLDVMDGHFVPNISYGPPVIKDWRKRSDLPFDAHLMISEPGRYLDAFVDAGCDVILFHIEVEPNPLELIRRIRRAECHAGLVLNPPTPFSAIEPYLAEVDVVLVMSVMPGFGGQKFQPEVLDKARAIRRARPGLRVSIDGGINIHTAGAAAEAGVTQMVVGSATFRPDGNYSAALAELTEAARQGVSSPSQSSPHPL